MPSIPTPIRASLGLLDATLARARELIDHAPELPVQAVGGALQLSMKAQQRFTDLTIRGDQVISRLRGTPEEPPSWATFDEELGAGRSTDLLVDDLEIAAELVYPDTPLAEPLNLDDPAELVEALLAESNSPLIEAPAAGKARALKTPGQHAAAVPAEKAQAHRTPAKTTPGNRTPAKKVQAKKVQPKKTQAKKTAAEKAAAEKAPAENAPARRAPAKKSPAQKSPAKKSPARSAPAEQATAAEQVIAADQATAAEQRSATLPASTTPSARRARSARPVSKFDLAGDLQAELDEPVES